MSILLYLIILLIGAYIGYKDNLKFLVKQAGPIQNYALFFLLFIMGIKIGLDREIIYSFGKIGFQGMILALSSIIFSVAGVKLVSSKIIHTKEDVEHDH